MKIFLVGFMGSGKSHVGKLLAEKLGFHFLDLDNLIENTEGVSVSALFEQRGEAYFRNVETDRLRGLEKWDDLVVATGGGAPCFNDNMAWLNEHGMTVYLKPTLDLLSARLENEVEKRPLLRGKHGETLRHFISEKLAARAQFYEKAHIVVDIAEDGEGVVFDILQKILNLRTAN